MNTSKLRNINETKLNEETTQIEMLFETSVGGNEKQDTIKLSGTGSLKVLQPV